METATKETEVLISFDELKFNLNINLLSAKMQPILQQVVNQYDTLGFGPLLNEQLPKLIINVDDLVLDKLLDGQAEISVNGLTFNRAKILEFGLVKMPKGFEKLKELINEDLHKEALRLSKSNLVAPKNDNDIPSFFDISVGGKVSIKESRIEGLKRYYSNYISSNEAIAVLNAGNEVLSIFNDIDLVSIVNKKFQRPGGINTFFEVLFIFKDGKIEKVNPEVLGILNRS